MDNEEWIMLGLPPEEYAGNRVMVCYARCLECGMRLSEWEVQQDRYTCLRCRGIHVMITQRGTKPRHKHRQEQIVQYIGLWT